MKPGSTYPSQTKAFLVSGLSGTGKTTLAMGFPAPFFIDSDRNLTSAIQRHPGKEFWYGSAEVDDETGKPVAPEHRWQRSLDLLTKHGNDPKVQTIVDDSLSKLQEYLMAYIIGLGSAAEKPLIIGGERVPTLTMWTPFKTLLMRRIIQARSLGKIYVLISHVKVEKDEIRQTLEYRPALSGQLGDNLGYLFTDAWACDTAPSSDRAAWPNGVRYFVRTAPTPRMPWLKNSMGLPAEFDFSWDVLRPHIEQTTQAATTPKS